MRHLRLLSLLFLAALSPVRAQPTPAAPCGVVDQLDFPIDGIVPGYDDFGLYRERFGGNHTGIDIGFDRWGDPIHAAARGRVTYSNPEGWDTEKGVVIIEHVFPDGSIVYTLYGHMEQSDTISFPAVGMCVERGQVIGAEGWPSRGRPHLHYEIRNFMPDDGGPGYVTDNPISHGWYNPLDFTALWRAKLRHLVENYVSFDVVPSLPPAQLESGQYVVASGHSLAGVQPPDKIAWRVDTDGVINGLAALPGGIAVAHTRSGQVVALQNGRYTAVWQVPGPPDVPILTLGDKLIFVTQDNGLTAYDVSGKTLWTVPGPGAGDVTAFEADGKNVMLCVRAADGKVLWRLVDGDGKVVSETQMSNAPLAEPTGDGSWMLLGGGQLEHYFGSTNQPIGNLSPPPGQAARMAVDFLGTSYIYLGDPDSTLVAVGKEGDVRWRVMYPEKTGFVSPMLATGGGCLLYALDADGMLNVFSTADGRLVDQLQLYAGGKQNTSPAARVLQADKNERLLVGSGFLTMMTLDGTQFGGDTLANCRLG